MQIFMDDKEFLDNFISQNLSVDQTKARALIERFGSIRKVLKASYEELLDVDCIDNGDALAIMYLRETAIRAFAIGELPNIKIAVNSDKSLALTEMRQSLIESFADTSYEHIAIYYLNKHFKIVEKGVLGSRHDVKADLDLKDFFKTIIRLSPTYVLLCHNHVNDRLLPSKADIRTTEKICALLSTTNSKLLDHIIITKKGIFSFYGEHLLSKIEESIVEKSEEDIDPDTQELLSCADDFVTPFRAADKDTNDES